MRKIVCDVCGNEITNLRESWDISISPNISLRTLGYDQTDYSLCLADVCEDCANSVYHYIKGLQKEENK